VFVLCNEDLLEPTLEPKQSFVLQSLLKISLRRVNFCCIVEVSAFVEWVSNMCGTHTPPF